MLELGNQGKIFFEGKQIPEDIVKKEFLMANFYEPLRISNNTSLMSIVEVYMEISGLIDSIFLENPKALANLINAYSTKNYQAIKVYPYMSIDHEGRMNMHTKFSMISSDQKTETKLSEIPVFIDESIQIESFFDLSINQNLFKSVTLASLADALFFELFEFLKNNPTDFDQIPLTQLGQE